MNVLCDTCLAPCCDSPIIKWPNSWIEQSIDWVFSGDWEFRKGDKLEDFLDTLKMRIEEAMIPSDFFVNTSNSERRLSPHWVDVEVNEEEEFISFFSVFYFYALNFRMGSVWLTKIGQEYVEILNVKIYDEPMHQEKGSQK